MYEFQKKITWSSLRVGIVVTAAILTFFAAVFFSGNIIDLFSRQFNLTTRISNVQGLRTGAPVWLFGVEVGTVEKITINSSGTYVLLSVDQKYQANIYKNSYTTIMTMGILGDKFVEIYPGDTSFSKIEPNDTIPGNIPIGFEQLLALAASAMTQLDSTLHSLDFVVQSIADSSGSLGKMLSDPSLYNNLNRSVRSLTTLINDISSSKGTFTKLIKDSTLYHNILNASEQFASIVNQVDTSITNGSVAGAIFSDDSLATDIRETVSSLKSAAQAINNILSDIKANPKKYFSFELF